MRPRTRLIRYLTIALLALPVSALAGQKVYTGWFSSTAIGGYDTVAYHTQGQAVEGSDAFTTQWQGATWQFANAEHLARFEANPEQYAPAYGGHCAYGVAKGDLVKVDPEAWSIVDGRLFLNYSDSIRNQWEANRASFIQRADNQWPQIGQTN